MNFAASSRRALVRAYETHPRSEVPPECADDHCADYEVMDSSDSVNALLHEAEKLQEYMDALGLARPRNGSDDGELYMKLRAECAELISDGFGDEVDPFTLLDGEISADTVQEFMEAVEAYKLEFLDIRDENRRRTGSGMVGSVYAFFGHAISDYGACSQGSSRASHVVWHGVHDEALKANRLAP